MPRSESVARQRTLGGVIGVLLLAFALSFHFFPRTFDVDPDQVAPRRSMSLGAAPAAARSASAEEIATSEVDAGPPLTLAPTAVIARRMTRNAPSLPQQNGENPPEVLALLDKAAKALKSGQVAGESNSAASLYQRALKLKPDSQRANQGLYEVRARLVAAIGQDLTIGDADAASDLLDVLRKISGSEADAKPLETRLTTLKKIRPMLAQAANLLQQGHAVQPEGDNALAVYRQVLTLDEDDAVARQGLLDVQRVVLDRALAAVAQNDFKAAGSALAQAQSIRPGSAQMTQVRTRVETMRTQRSTGLLAQAVSALDAGNIDLAQQLAAQAQSISDTLSGLKEFRERLINARLYASFKPGQVFSDRFVDMPGQTPAMVVIPTGRFTMGAPTNEDGHNDAETPQHKVTFAKGFAIALTEVTVGQFRDFVRASGYKPDSERLGGSSVYDERSGTLREDSSATWQDDYAGRKAGDDLPVVNVSWNDAQAYAAWLAKRTSKPYTLPSEAQFEYALRGGTTTPYWWGRGTPGRTVENVTGSNDRSKRGRRWSNAFSDYRDGYWGPAPVRSFQPNPFGLYDMDGNVSEWTEDCWHESYLRAPRDGTAWLNPGCSAHAMRGGSWGSAPDQVRSAYRQGVSASLRSGRVGFRVVRVL